MNNALLYPLIAMALISSTACTSSSVREPAATSNSRAFSYRTNQSCISSTNHLGVQDSGEWGALSGYLVGPSQMKQFESPKAQILRPFSSDGCSSSPDGLSGSDQSRNWTECCVAHDAAYWPGGTEEQKAKADEELQQCITRKGFPKVGRVYKAFVEKFGGPQSSYTYRWGYGWNYRRGFSPLTPSEEAQVVALSGMDIESAKKHYSEQWTQLVTSCNAYDNALRRISDEEVEMYRYLNANLKAESVIEWNQLTYFNLQVRKYLVKLASCDEPVVFNFSTKKQLKSVENNCEILIK